MTAAKLTKKQLKALDLLTSGSYDRRLSDLAGQLHVSLATLYRWLRSGPFHQALLDECNKKIKSMIPAILNALMKKAGQGDIQATKLILQICDLDSDDGTGGTRSFPQTVVWLPTDVNRH